MPDRSVVDVITLVDRLGPALQNNDCPALNDIIAQLVAQKAPMGEQWQQLAQIAASIGAHRLALQAIDLFVDHWGGRPSALFQKAVFLSVLNKWHEADALLQTISENIPDPASNIQWRATAALNLGRIGEAQQHLDRLTQMRPALGNAWLSLSMAVDFKEEPALAERLIEAGPELNSAPALQQSAYHYALGKVHADRGAHDLAFEAFAHGARLKKAIVGYDAEADRATAASAIDGYTANKLAALSRQQSEPTGRTIFVSGLPRTGTTLVEQILTSHSQVADGGEIARLYLLSDEVGGTDWAALERHAETRDAARTARLWNHWLDELYPEPGRVVDKTIEASRFLGLAAGLLPDAPLIWMTRDPLDCAWSCYRTNFMGSAMSWSYDLEDIAAHFRLEDALLEQWRDILGERLLVLSYEALVSDPEQWIPRVLAHCGLSAEPQVFTPHETDRSVMTASMVQVRRPINRAGIGAAAPYRDQLAPFIKAYYG